jgi:hypothetical protein
MPYAVATVALALLAANVHTTRRLLRAPFGDRTQTRLQLAFLWLVPGAGCALLLHLLNEDAPGRRRRARPAREGDAGGAVDDEEGDEIDFEYVGHYGHYDHDGGDGHGGGAGDAACSEAGAGDAGACW